MKLRKLYDGGAVYALLILAFLAIGCSLGNINAGENASENSGPVETGFGNDENLNQTKAGTQAESAAAVFGTYEYDTEKDGEGYDNTLEITDAGKGKLNVYISGSYIYKIGETQSFHEAEGKGEAILKGSVADATLVDEAGRPCRATIAFMSETADVQIPDTCQFNIALGGVYKRAESKAEKPENTGTQKPGRREIEYEKAMDFVNDFDARKTGEEFIVTRVPIAIIDKKNRADAFGNKSYKGLYFLEGVTADDTPSYSFLTSKAMIDSLNREVEYEPAFLRMTAVIVESRGKFDVYRMPFVTKIEGLNDDAAVIWTASGEQPAKLNFTH